MNGLASGAGEDTGSAVVVPESYNDWSLHYLEAAKLLKTFFDAQNSGQRDVASAAIREAVMEIAAAALAYGDGK